MDIIINKAICKIKGHDLTVAYFRDAFYPPVYPIVSFHFDGRVEVKKPDRKHMVFIHKGLVSDCNRCGDVVDVDKETTELPIQYPDGEIIIKADRVADIKQLGFDHG
jgi:hypothetical protein